MTEIIIASPDAGQLTEFSEALAQTSELTVIHTDSPASTLAAVADPKVSLLVVDARISTDEGKQLVRDTLMANAMIISVVLSDTAEERFHENMEGLGVLMQLPLTPTKNDAQALWERYQAIHG
jgi:DNA-binding NtrC family response regulator